MEGFLHLLQEEYHVLLGRKLITRAGNSGKARQVASNENALGMTATVIGISGNLVDGQVAEKHVAKQGDRRFLTACYLERHRTMNAHQPCVDGLVKQNGDVTVTNKPFGVLMV